MIGECYGDGALVRFAGRVSGQRGQDVAIRITGSLGFETSQESIRIEAEGIEGTIRTEEGEAALLVTDLSPLSLGGLTSAFLAIGAVHGLMLRSSGDTLDCRVGVVNCRLDPLEAGGCRVGLRIVELSRLDSARWMRLIERMALR